MKMFAEKVNVVMQIHTETTNDWRKAIKCAVNKRTIPHRTQCFGSQVRKRQEATGRARGQDNADEVGTRFLAGRCGRGFHP